MEVVYEYIEEVYKAGSFTRAAQFLHISQPALSIAIKKFEDEIGHPIFIRSSKPITLTSVGEIIYRHIEEIKNLEINTKAEINDTMNKGIRNLRIGGTQYFTAFIIPNMIVKIKESFPDINIEIIEASSVSLMEALDKNEIDVMYSVKDLDITKYSFYPGITDYLFFAIPRKFISYEAISDFLITRDEIVNNEYRFIKSVSTLDILKNLPFITLRNGNNLYSRAMMIFELEGFRPKIELNLDQLTTAHYNCMCGIGTTLTTNHLIKKIDDEDKLYYIKLEHELMARNFKLIMKKDKYVSLAMETVLSIMSDFI